MVRAHVLQEPGEEPHTGTFLKNIGEAARNYIRQPTYKELKTQLEEITDSLNTANREIHRLQQEHADSLQKILVLKRQYDRHRLQAVAFWDKQVGMFRDGKPNLDIFTFPAE